LLRQYERTRAEPVLAMASTVEGLFTLFASGNPVASRLRNAGLNVVERLPLVKNLLMRQAMR
jgi:2-polyprenylphenol 6-hydroxylase